VLGLRWHNVDEAENEVRIRQQVQRVKGELRLYPVKTTAGRRDLPLLPGLVVDALVRYAGLFRPPIAPSWAGRGRTPASFSVPKQVGQSSRGTLSGHSGGSARITICA
jgi:hypothetical protein